MGAYVMLAVNAMFNSPPLLVTNNNGLPSFFRFWKANGVPHLKKF